MWLKSLSGRQYIRKMKTTCYLLLATLMVSVISCKKDGAVNKSPGVNNPVKDTPVLLTRLVVLDPLTASPNDTLAVYEVEYDSSYRPVILNFKAYQYATAPSYISTLHYEYAGTDTLASKTTSLNTTIYNGTTTYLHDTMYYTYEAGRRTADSLVASDGFYYETRHYSYFANRIEASYSFVRPDPYYTRDGHDVYYGNFSNGNLVSQKDTLMYNYLSSGGPAEQWTIFDYSFTYLPNPDPFYKVISPIRRLYFNEGDWVWENTPLFVSPNLPSSSYRLDEQWNTGGTGGGNNAVSTGEYDYTFRADGYPLIMRQVDHEGGVLDRYFKLVYSYNK